MTPENAPRSFMLAMRLAGLVVGYALYGIFGALVGAFAAVFAGVLIVISFDRANPCGCAVGPLRDRNRKA
jgi:hypothetical protein